MAGKQVRTLTLGAAMGVALLTLAGYSRRTPTPRPSSGWRISRCWR